MARPRVFRTAVFPHLDHKLKPSLIVIRTLRALSHQRQHSLLHVLLVLGASLTLQVSGGFLKNPSGAGFGGSDLSGPCLVLIEINLRGPRLLVPALADPFKGAVCTSESFDFVAIKASRFKFASDTPYNSGHWLGKAEASSRVAFACSRRWPNSFHPLLVTVSPVSPPRASQA